MSDRNENVLFSALSDTKVLFPEKNKKDPVEIVQSIAEEVDFKNIKKKRKNWREKPIEDWNNNDLLNFFLSRFYRKFGYTLECSLMPARQNMLRTCESLKRQIGTWPKPELAKHYLDWFIDNQLPELLGKYSVFKFSYLYHPNNIRGFIVWMDADVIDNIQNAEEDENAKSKVVFEGTLIDFVCDNGLMYSLAYFKNQGKTALECCSIVASAIQMIEKANRYEEFALSTKNNGPYPSSLKFKKLDKMFSKIAELSGRRVSMLRIEFSDKAKEIEFVDNQ